VLAGCATEPATRDYKLNSSYLRAEPIVKEDMQVITSDAPGADGATSSTRIPSMVPANQGFTSDSAIADRFSKTETLTIAADNMALVDYLHYSFGELLKSNYILGEGLTALAPVTLNVQQKISPQKLFTMTEQLLLERGVGIKRQNEMLYISRL